MKKEAKKIKAILNSGIMFNKHENLSQWFKARVINQCQNRQSIPIQSLPNYWFTSKPVCITL